MKGINITPAPLQQVPQHFHPGMEKAVAELRWAFKALAEYLEELEPGASEVLARRVFYHKCFAVMLSKATAKAKATPDTVLDVGIAHNKVIGELEREANERNWLDVLGNARRNAEHAAKEM